jgi:hypothetical protein
MPKRFAHKRDTLSGSHEAARELGVPLVEHPDFDQPRLMLDEEHRPWFVAIPTWWYRRKDKDGAA